MFEKLKTALRPRSARVRTGDALSNLVAGMMTSRDKRAHSKFRRDDIIDREELAAMYRHNWLARKIVDAPAEDMTREWLKPETAARSSRRCTAITSPSSMRCSAARRSRPRTTRRCVRRSASWPRRWAARLWATRSACTTRCSTR
ncbi:anti-CBASS protein Acb1 family protein [Burkholderia stagnalis]|uniref:anti-CBASS protein Acb1 family protein n=1 Tax=Burkholderia stagnalis TaxID=1503054 RepID=UPI000F589C23|nr:anti-CBASS Acb1 family protein [Burkholderia stagnalis]RQQ42012.1 DUF1073 domain-containing protein [Burkholderia stagnalis]RQX87135.1 DUF1073 domain-containing protein [Burkholderia stagnalis]RQY07223.1 DUF1073 domain-containing protein [Burkholderia stagnalis]RQY22285.1 DUF1073 domain-containing protein [Burkholderia stagnalis]